MKCPEYQELLQRRLDGEPIVYAADVEQHLAECSICSGLEASAQALLDGLQALAPPQCPPHLAQRITDAVLQDRRQALRRQRLHLVVTGSIAASVVGLAVGGYFLTADRQAGNPPPVAANNLPPTQPPLAPSVAGAQQAFAALSKRWVGKAGVQAKIILTAADPAQVADVAHVPEATEPLDVEPAAQSLRQASVEVVASVQPVAHTARRAFSFFVHELPVLKSNRQ